MLISKKKQIKYLGFDDFWFIFIGVIIVGFVTDYLFNRSFDINFIGEALIDLSLSIFITTCDWFLVRAILIFMRKRYPDFKDNVKRIGLVLLTIITAVLLVDFLLNILLLPISANTYNFLARSKVLLTIILISSMVFAIYEAIYFYIRLEKSIREEEQAKLVLIQMELDGLRNQAQPHFFFNTLNTLRDIIDQNPKEDAKKFVDKLSDVYRFLLESGNDNLISLRDELRFSKAYIYIQSERFGNNLKLNWSIPETSLDTMIAPISLQLLLENAIKHNVISKAKQLVVNVEVKGDYLVVYNRIQSKSTQLPSTKLGLKNIENRYALLSSKSIEIINDGNRFTVSLPLLKKVK